MTEVEKLVERLNEGAQRVLDYCFRGNPAARGLVTIPRHPDDIDALLMEAARRVEELEGALKVFAAIVPSSLHPADGSEAEAYVIMLHDPKMLGQGGAPDFTGADLARARSALSEGSGSSRELAPPDESGDAQERANERPRG